MSPRVLPWATVDKAFGQTSFDAVYYYSRKSDVFQINDTHRQTMMHIWSIFSSLTAPVTNGGKILLLALAVSFGILAAGFDDARGEDATFNPEYKSERPKGEKRLPAEDLPKVDLDLRSGSVDERIGRIMEVMTLDEKIGQLCQIASYGSELSEDFKNELRAGRVGSLFYTGNAEQSREANRIAMQESRLGLPLLIPRDVIHGFRTVFPIPLGQAASWNPELIGEAAAVAARESAAEAVNWTFAPMLDIARDARWGRIAESVGEDPLLASAIARAMVEGYQGDESRPGIAACAKHFVGYGLSEGGRDYNRSQVGISELHSIFLPPFHAAVESGCATVMTGFNTVNGVPVSGHRQLIDGVLKERWGFDGLVVSDYGSIFEMIEHGYAANEKQAARLAINAGMDMEMATDTFRKHMRALVTAGAVKEKTIDEAVERILRTKLHYALPTEDASFASASSEPTEESLEVSRKLARQSMVLLKNAAATLPLDASKLKKVAVMGPLADAARDQLGCWMLDGKAEEAVTPAAAIEEVLAGQAKVTLMPVLSSSVDMETENIERAVGLAQESDAVVLCVGEGWNLSGEARSRAALHLPGAQSELVKAICETDTPVILVVLSGRPLTIGDEVARADAVLYAWHPGTMGGPALADLLLGKESPSGKLPVTFAKHVGQSPLYYNHPRTGRPAHPDTKPLFGSGRDDWPNDRKYKSHYLDVDPFPQFPFGYGLSYTKFEYGEPKLTRRTLNPGQTLGVRVELKNAGRRAAEEVAQLYVQDVTGRLVRPVRELKAFRRVRLEPGESTLLEFALSTDDLAYYDNRAKHVLEPGKFKLGVGGDSTAELSAEFRLRKMTKE